MRRALVMLDEPFTGIDEATSRELMDLILEMHPAGTDHPGGAASITGTTFSTPRRCCC